MKEIKNVYLIGLGAIGCIYSSRIYDNNKESLKIIADKKRIDRYSKDGFIINNKRYDFNYISPEDKAEAADLIIISVKFNNIKEAIASIKNFVSKDTIILSLLNGINSEEVIAETYNKNNIPYSICVGIDAVRDGNKVDYSKFGNLTFGDKDNSTYSNNVLAIKNYFDKSKVPYVIPSDMLNSMWWKFMVNVGVNQASSILKANYGVFQKSKEANALLHMIMNEVIEISKHVGANLNQSDIEKWDKILNSLSPNNKTSMLQDIENKRFTEVDIFSGEIIKLGEKYKVSCPVNKMLYNMIKTIEQNY
ncbi:MAG: ketopantoate reductase family protein [Clostridiaceae bacterium]